ncbi:MAG: oxygen-independent coproporphyrinogen III oxidase [Fulvivirga sp.]|uniref:oxygen-independent coproporphyrinogen III oxidase n=1 Tax=Fulvivirga sp. TaxID=1931237 RepID=UPI0032EDB3E6
MPDLKKYNQPVPRYTSYPTVPFWERESFTIEGYENTLQSAFWESSREVSIYIHLPFCESLCTYCACNTRITKNHQVEGPYVTHLLKEWELYLQKLPERPFIREIHLGGGTPTFFAPENLRRLLSGIIEGGSLSREFQMSFEGHPANTTAKHLETLYQIGFDRVSFGIQDFDLSVQKLINRMQSFEQVKSITEKAREIGYTSVNYDVVYGLPGQTIESIKNTLHQIIELKPERVAYYSYAHVPSMRPAQKSYEAHLPDEDNKWKYMQLGKQTFLDSGYEEVGMDHFVLPGDVLLEARRNGELHRNFMGYTPFICKLLIGLGVSSISDSWSGFAQNEKNISKYYELLAQGQLPIIKGHIHTKQDLFFRRHILNLMCNFETTWHESEFMEYCVALNYDLLDQLQEENLITYGETGIKVLPQGREVIRVICTALDAKMYQSNFVPQYSKSV